MFGDEKPVKTPFMYDFFRDVMPKNLALPSRDPPPW